jgi:hypothetical protein
MANVQAAFGFKHIGYISGYAPDYQRQPRLIQATQTTKIFFGDPVIKQVNSSYIIQGTGSTSTILEGIFDGCNYVPTGGLLTQQQSPFWPGSAASDATGYLINAPGALFLAAALNTAIVTSNIGANIGYAIGTGSTVGGGFSGATLDQSTITTATAPFQIVSLYQGVGNGSDPSTPFNWAIVTFSNQRFRTLTGVT